MNNALFSHVYTNSVPAFSLKQGNSREGKITQMTIAAPYECLSVELHCLACLVLQSR